MTLKTTGDLATINLVRLPGGAIAVVAQPAEPRVKQHALCSTLDSKGRGTILLMLLTAEEQNLNSTEARRSSSALGV